MSVADGRTVTGPTGRIHIVRRVLEFDRVHRRPRRHFAAVSGSRPTTRRETALAAARYGPEGTADRPPHQTFDRANRQGELLDPPRLAVVAAEARTPTPSSPVGGNRRCRGPRSGSNSHASRGPKFSVPSYYPRP